MMTPLAMDPAHPFPFISNLALNLLVTLRYPAATRAYMARVKVPVEPGRLQAADPRSTAAPPS